MVEVNSALKKKKQNSKDPLNAEQKAILAKIANTIRGLSMDAVQKAESGHPGLPMGTAEIAAYLWGYFLHYNPKDPHWPNRDPFILSAGHGSMMLYSVLHLTGYNVSLDDIKNFRQLHSKTPGHPESLDTEGVETTTGPLGQGVGNAVGHALGMKLLQAKFNTERHRIFDQKVVCLCGDGDLMEGVSAEVSSLAGHLRLDNLIMIYDSNHVCLDGPTSETFTDNTKMRYEAYGWEVFEMDGHNLDDIHRVLTTARENQSRPRLIIAHTIIGKGSPHKEGTSKAHGAPLGVEEVKATKEILGIPLEPLFYVPQEVRDFFAKKIPEDQALEKEWRVNFEAWGKENPELLRVYEDMAQNRLPNDLEQRLKAIDIKSPISGRKASNEALNVMATFIPQLYGGSADLSGSDLTMLKNYPLIAPGNFSGRNIKYGVREFGMATIATGLFHTGMIIPYVGTFLTFSDYMRNAIRLAALQQSHVMYQFTHDSIFLGEDGPTHQPIEHYAALRAIPFLQVIRPGDAYEVKMSWIAALRYKGPTALLLSRQNLPEIPETKNFSYAEGVGRGAYILKKEKGKVDYTLIATGSELHLAIDVAAALEKKGKNVRVVSMPCWELYEEQDQKYKESVFGGDIGVRVSIEAGVEMGWHKYIGTNGIAISMHRFGASAPAEDLAKEFGFTVDAILNKIL